MISIQPEGLRVSASALCDIRDGDRDRVALLENENARNRGKRLLVPIGGAVKATDLGVASLKELLDLRTDDFEKGNDLRFNMPTSGKGEFLKWFLRKGSDYRETSPHRELREELVDETGILEDRQLAGTHYELLGYGTEQKDSLRTGEPVTTLRVAEIFGVRLPESAMNTILAVDERGEGPLHFVDPAEIRNGLTRRGIPVETIASLVLDPRPHPDFGTSS